MAFRFFDLKNDIYTNKFEKHENKSARVYEKSDTSPFYKGIGGKQRQNDMLSLPSMLLFEK